MTMSNPKRVHPSGILIRFLQEIRQLFFPLIAVLLFSRNQTIPWPWQLMFILLWLFFIVLHGFLSWYRFTYQIDKEQIHIQSGIFIRRKRHIHRNRVHTINQSAGILQRLFGTVQLRIETAGGGTEPEVRLTAVTKEEARRIRSVLDPHLRSEHAESSDPHESSASPSSQKAPFPPEKGPAYRLPAVDLFVASFTSASFGVVLAGLAVIISQFAEYLPESFYASAYRWFIEQSVLFIAGILLGAAIIAWIISVMITLLQYARFQVSLEGDRCTIQRGLLEKKEVHFTRNKIQAVRLIETPLRQLLGYVAVVAESAGGSDDPSGSIIVVPLIKRRHVQSFMEKFLPQYVPALSFERSPARGLRRYVVRAVWLPLALALAGCYFLPSPWKWYFLLLPLIGCWIGWARWRDAGWNLQDKHLTLRYRIFARCTVVTHKKRIQALQIHQSLFQRRGKLINIKIHILSAGARAFKIIHLDEKAGRRLYEWYGSFKQNQQT